MKSLKPALFFLTLLVSIRVCNGQTAFERAVTYANQVADLNNRYIARQNDLADGLQNIADLSKLYREALGDSAKIQEAGKMQEFVYAVESLEQAYINQSVLQNRQMRARRNELEYRMQVEHAGQVVVLASQLSQLHSANNVTNARLQKLLTEITRLSKELQETQQKQQDSLNEYIALADIFGLRTQLELNAALRELVVIPDENLGARYLKAVTLRRTGAITEAEAELADLIELQTTHTPRFIAAQAELLSLQDKNNEAEKLLNKLTRVAGKTDYYHAYRGLVLANAKSWKEAVVAWNASLRHGGDEIALNRNLAIVLASLTGGKQSDVRKALEHAELASKLSQKKEWSVELALALALSANDEQEDAQKNAELACELTSGECSHFCGEMRESLHRMQPIEWDFRTQ